MNRELQTRLLLPRGEWLSSLLTAFAVAGLELGPIKARSLEYTFASASLPIIFSAVRAAEVWQTISEPNSSVSGGFTGTDIVREQLATASWFFPLKELNPKAPAPRLYIGATPNVTQKGKQPSLNSLNGTRVYTTYPNSTALFLSKQGIRAEIVQRQGAIEGFWRLDPQNGAVVDISDSGATMNDNDIAFMQYLSEPERVTFVAKNLDERDWLRVNDLQELLTQAVQKRRT